MVGIELATYSDLKFDNLLIYYRLFQIFITCTLHTIGIGARFCSTDTVAFCRWFIHSLF